MREPNKAGHWLEGKVAATGYDSIANALDWMPPTSQELTLFGLEEKNRPAFLGGDRSEVYRLLAYHKQRLALK